MKNFNGWTSQITGEDRTKRSVHFKPYRIFIVKKKDQKNWNKNIEVPVIYEKLNMCI